MLCLNVSILLFITQIYLSNACHMLSFSGGGAFGAVEIGMLQNLVDNKKIQETPNILTGVSAGGLNAGFLSSSLSQKSIIESIDDLSNIYRTITSDSIYDLKWNPSSWSIYQTHPLNETIHKILSQYIISVTEPTTFIGTSNLETGLLDVIRFDELTTLYDRVQLLLATSAIPIVFPPVNWKDTLYVDGGLISNEIIFEAIPYLQCECNSPVIWYFEPVNDLRKIGPVTNIINYFERIFSIVTNGFDNQLQKILQDRSNTCPQNQTSILINVCHPNTDGLEALKQYSVLDFNKGNELLNIGYKSVECDSWIFCQ